MVYYDIFKKCFPDSVISEETFKKLINPDNIHIIEYCEGDVVCGFAFVFKNAVRLICVLPDYCKNKIGSKLLSDCEKYIKDNGYNEVIIGGASSELFIGAVSESAGFFEKCGYNSIGESEEMYGDIKSFNSQNYNLPIPDGCSFGWFEGDFDKLKVAVGEVADDWISYFSPQSRIFCGYLDGKIASFCLVDYESECLLYNGKNKVGVIGCVGTIPSMRRKGIGLKMVALASDDLRENGCDLCFIHYTSVAHWYAKIGYKTFLKLYFYRKSI